MGAERGRNAVRKRTSGVEENNSLRPGFERRRVRALPVMERLEYLFGVRNQLVEIGTLTGRNVIFDRVFRKMRFVERLAGKCFEPEMER